MFEVNHSDDKYEVTALICAARNKSTPVEVFKLLIESGADVNHWSQGDTALHIVIKTRTHFQQVIRVLLSAGADVNMLDSDGKNVV